MDEQQVAGALRQIGHGFLALAAALVDPDQPSEEDRQLALMREWGNRGLTRPEASALFRRHGFAPQAAGGWARGDWLTTSSDDRRYLTERSQQWVAQREEAGRG